MGSSGKKKDKEDLSQKSQHCRASHDSDLCWAPGGEGGNIYINQKKRRIFQQVSFLAVYSTDLNFNFVRYRCKTIM